MGVWARTIQRTLSFVPNSRNELVIEMVYEGEQQQFVAGEVLRHPL
jgi:hypothetical protein